MTVYLLHFDTPLGNRGGHTAQHYMGWTTEGADALRRRTDQHLYGISDAAIVRAARERGIDPELVRVWHSAGRDVEHKLKRAGHLELHCWRCLLAKAFVLKTQYDAEVDLCPQEVIPSNKPPNAPSTKLVRPAGTPSHIG